MGGQTHHDGEPRARARGQSAGGLCEGLWPHPAQVKEPVIIHWLGEMFDPALAGYWGAADHTAGDGDLPRDHRATTPPRSTA